MLYCANFAMLTSTNYMHTARYLYAEHVHVDALSPIAYEFIPVHHGEGGEELDRAVAA